MSRTLPPRQCFTLLEAAINYYERHIGDYLKDTAHLSLLEHGVYARLLDVYYTREGGIPDREAARLIGARSKDEREALAAVLEEFFTLVDGVHVQDRCEREVARFQDKQRKAKASADARWSKAPEQSERNANADANASPDAMRTHTEGNAPRARPQTPDTKHQTPEDRGPRQSATGAPDPVEIVGDAKPTRAGELCRLMKAEGIQATNPGHPDLLALIAAGVTDDEIRGAARGAAGKGDPFAYALAALTKQRQRAAATTLHAGPLPPTETAYQRSQRERMQQVVPSIAAKAPGAINPNPMEVLDGLIKRIG